MFHPLSLVRFATATVVTFVLLRKSRFNFHCYPQHEAMPTQKLARKWHSDLLRLLVRKITKGIHSANQLHWTAQQDAPKWFFSSKSQSSGQQKMTQRHFFPPSIPFPRYFLQLQRWWHLYCFTILGSTSIVIHSMKQCLLRNWPRSDTVTSCAKDYKGHSLVQASFTEPPNIANSCRANTHPATGLIQSHAPTERNSLWMELTFPKLVTNNTSF